MAEAAGDGSSKKYPYYCYEMIFFCFARIFRKASTAGICSCPPPGGEPGLQSVAERQCGNVFDGLGARLVPGIEVGGVGGWGGAGTAVLFVVKKQAPVLDLPVGTSASGWYFLGGARFSAEPTVDMVLHENSFCILVLDFFLLTFILVLLSRHAVSWF